MILIEPVLISAIEHYSYCPRQCGLIHVESVWDENQFTIRGRIAHERADEPITRTERGVRVERALPIWSDEHSLVGKADVVEFHGETPVPIEYKSGKPTQARHAMYQLCAQAICLEEMFATAVPMGFLFFAATKERKQVDFDEEMRQTTLEIVEGIRRMQAKGKLPPPVNDKRCPKCSLIDACLPGPVTQAMSKLPNLYAPCSEADLS